MHKTNKQDQCVLKSTYPRKRNRETKQNKTKMPPRRQSAAAAAAAKRIYSNNENSGVIDTDETASHFTTASTQLPHSTDTSLSQENPLFQQQQQSGGRASSRQQQQHHQHESPKNNNKKQQQQQNNNKNKISFGPAVEALENSRGPAFTYEAEQTKHSPAATGALSKKNLKKNSSSPSPLQNHGGDANNSPSSKLQRTNSGFHPDPLLASQRPAKGGGGGDNYNAENNQNQNVGDDEGENHNKNDHDDNDNGSNERVTRGGGGGRVGFADAVETVESSIGSESQSDGSHDSNSESNDDPNGGVGGGSSSASSSSSGSSNARRSRDIAARPMVLYMTLLIAIPVLFLAIYQGISVGNAQSTLNFMFDHEDPVQQMIGLQKMLHKEMEVVSSLIGARLAYSIDGEVTSLPSWAPPEIQKLTDEAASRVLDTRQALSRLILAVSDGAGAIQLFHPRAVELPEFLARAEIAATRNNGKLFRTHLNFVMEELTVMISILQADSRAKIVQIELTDLVMLSLVEERLVDLVSMYIELEYTYNASSVVFDENSTSLFEQNCIDFASVHSKLNGFTKFLSVGSGNKLITDEMKYFRNTGFPPIKEIFSPFLACDFSSTQENKTIITWADATSLLQATDALIDRIISVQLSVLESIVDNDEVKQTSLVEGMKLMVALICCVVGVVIVINIQQREKKELLQIISHAEKLSLAVRRFVPKNQLRMMGVRTVLQIEPGYSTEIANALIHSDIRAFTSLSENMTRMELFDWLQMYVSRMTFVVRSCRGFIDSLRGDGLVSVFPGSATDGVNAAIMMQQETDHMNVDLVAQKQTELVRIGVGVHFGVVVAGVFGDDSRLTCTMVSSEVNLCSRLEEMTKAYGTRIIVSRAVVDQIDPDLFELRTLGAIEATSVNRDLEIFDLYQSDPANLKQFKNDSKEEFERAIQLMSQDGNIDAKKEARSIFLKLRHDAAERQLIDAPLELKLTELESGVKNTMKSLESIVSQQEATGSYMNSVVNENLIAELMKSPGQQPSLGSGRKGSNSKERVD